MRRTIPLAAVVAVTLALTACGGDPEPPTSGAAPATPAPSASASPSDDASGAGGLYVALGDSLAAGYQPGGAELRDTAYPALTATRLEAGGGDLTLENLGCSGETTTSLVEGGKCDFAAGSQLEQAEKLLTGSEDVALVTIDIGGNDLLRCVRGGAQIDTACVTSGVATVKKNLPDDPRAAQDGGRATTSRCWCSATTTRGWRRRPSTSRSRASTRPRRPTRP